MNIAKKIKWGINKRIRLFFNPYEKIFSNPQSRFHFVGIGGIGMSAIAFVMNKMGLKITGSDISSSSITEKLEKAGIRVFIGHAKENIHPMTDMVVVSSAIPKNNPEIEAALGLGIPIVKRSFVLGQLMGKKEGIAVSGTHGKTTTTTMLSLILEKAKLDPIALIGGEVKNIGGNFLAGEGKYLVAEACEYDRSFLDLLPKVAIITNIEADHLDYYENLEEIKEAFRKFVRGLPEDGLLVVYADDINNMDVAKEAKCKVVGFGFGSKNRMQDSVFYKYWEIEEVTQGVGEVRFSLSDGKDFGEFSLRIPGKHNIANACASIIVADYLGVDKKIMKDLLSEFCGTNRRFEIKGEKKGVTVVDDYGHHPTEVKSTLEGAKKFFKGKKIIAVFEPHQYSRTFLLKKEFGSSFGNADLVIVPGIYASRDSEEDKKKITADDLVGEITANGVSALYIPGYDDVVKYLKDNIGSGSVILTMGAGSVYKVGESFLE